MLGFPVIVVGCGFRRSNTTRVARVYAEHLRFAQASHARTRTRTRSHSYAHAHAPTQRRECITCKHTHAQTRKHARTQRVRIIRRIRVRVIGISGSKTRASALPPECCCAAARADCTSNLELRDPLRVAHRAALPAQHYRHCRHIIGIIGTVGVIGGIGIIGTGVGCTAVHRLRRRRVSAAVSVRRPFRGRAAHRDRLRRGRRRGYSRARGRGRAARARGGRRSAWGRLHAHTRVRHGPMRGRQQAVTIAPYRRPTPATVGRAR